jgi:alkanesulfonate monooxygenase SsuD/methylene tetrahydromethanopterin reductase-like flavin-dependent oxidoreductase (luciferase family)
VPLRVGVVILPELRWAHARERWVRAEEYGFDHAWTYDHLAWRSLADGPWFATVPTLTAAATATSRIRLGTFVASPNYRHPVPFAKEVMTLDDISGGRLTLGLGAGGTGVDALVLGEPLLTPPERAARLEEFVGLLDELLTTPRVNAVGERYVAVDARMVPGCLQHPRVPFVVAANGSRMLRLAARHGQGWVTTGPSEVDGDLAAWWRGVGELAERLDHAMADAGRAPDDIDRFLSLDSSGTGALSSIEQYRDGVGRAAELGFTDVVVHWPRPHGVYAADEDVLEAVAEDLAAR